MLRFFAISLGLFLCAPLMFGTTAKKRLLQKSSVNYLEENLSSKLLASGQ